MEKKRGAQSSLKLVFSSEVKYKLISTRPLGLDTVQGIYNEPRWGHSEIQGSCLMAVFDARCDRLQSACLGSQKLPICGSDTVIFGLSKPLNQNKKQGHLDISNLFLIKLTFRFTMFNHYLTSIDCNS